MNFSPVGCTHVGSRLESYSEAQGPLAPPEGDVVGCTCPCPLPDMSSSTAREVTAEEGKKIVSVRNSFHVACLIPHQGQKIDYSSSRFLVVECLYAIRNVCKYLWVDLINIELIQLATVTL